MILNDDNTLYCERRQSDVAVSRCGEYQRRGECECEAGARGWIEYTARLSTKNPSYSEMRRRYPTKREVEVDNKKKCSNGCGGTVPKGWSTDLCRKCARKRNDGLTQEAVVLPPPKVKVKNPETIVRHAQHAKAMEELMDQGMPNLGDVKIECRGGPPDPPKAHDRGPSVVLQTFNIEYPSGHDSIFDEVERFIVHLISCGVDVKIQVKVIVHPEGLS